MTITDTNETDTLFNFRLPVQIKTEFQDTCRDKRVPMTSELIRLIREYLQSNRVRHSVPVLRPLPKRLLDPDTGLEIDRR